MNTVKLLVFITFIAIFFHVVPLAAKDLADQVNAIQTDLEKIRGSTFKYRVKAANQSVDEFGEYIDKMLDKQIPNRLAKNYGKVVGKLGLYRGPEIKNFKRVAKTLLQSQAAAYYDPDSSTFYVVMQNLPPSLMGSVYAHEIYHGYQDQHYNLNDYLLSHMQKKSNDDEILARQAVVEGEATYIMTLWTLHAQLGSLPSPGMISMAVNMQAGMDINMLKKMLKSGMVTTENSNDIKKSIEAMDNIPPFMIETMVGAYLKGMKFVYEIQKQGWKQVEQLYKNPPVSSEQILHPEKWLKGEIPYHLEWPSFAGKLFSDWVLLETNTIGEMQWRIIFSEYGMNVAGLGAAEGWDGDSFAVFEHKQNKKLLLLAYTCWDTEKEAQEFTTAYTTLLKTKYPAGKETIILQPKGRDLLIIEGGMEKDSDALLAFMQRIKKVKK